MAILYTKPWYWPCKAWYHTELSSRKTLMSDEVLYHRVHGEVTYTEACIVMDELLNSNNQLTVETADDQVTVDVSDLLRKGNDGEWSIRMGADKPEN